MSNGFATEKIPLSVLLFHAAMERDQSLSDFAAQLGIGPISLRQFIQGKTQRPRQKTLDLIGSTLSLSGEEVRERLNTQPSAAPEFGVWLQDLIEKNSYSRAKLTRETKISDGALRNYLSGQTLPDADQAQRLVQVLNLDALEVAHIIIANQVADAGGALSYPEDAIEESALSVGETGDNGSEKSSIGVSAIAAGLALSPAVAGEEQLLSLWRLLHPQGRRATLQYIAGLLVEG